MMVKRLSKFRVVLLLMLGAILFSSCTGSEAEEQLEPTAESESFPTGTFFRKIGAGYTEFEFFDDGTYTLGFQKDVPAVQGEYDVDGQTFTFLSHIVVLETIPDLCGTLEGSYTWVFEDKVLLFQVDAEDCTDRAMLIDGKEFVLEEE